MEGTMIWIDFGIICIGQEKESVPFDMEDLLIEGYQRTAESEPFYNATYNFCTADRLQGYWYNIWLPEPVCFDESFFDIAYKNVPYIKVVPKWAEQVKRILAFYINESPVKRIAVLLRVQDISNDAVHTDCKLDDFFQKLIEGNVKWNELYYVHF